MTDKAAEKEARARWGRNGATERRTFNRYSVGFVSLGMFFEVRGQGATWEEAFADADAKAVRGGAKA